MSPEFSYGCAVFLDADRVNFQKEGYSKEEMLAGLALVLRDSLPPGAYEFFTDGHQKKAMAWIRG